MPIRASFPGPTKERRGPDALHLHMDQVPPITKQLSDHLQSTCNLSSTCIQVPRLSYYMYIFVYVQNMSFIHIVHSLFLSLLSVSPRLSLPLPLSLSPCSPVIKGGPGLCPGDTSAGLLPYSGKFSLVQISRNCLPALQKKIS